MLLTNYRKECPRAGVKKLKYREDNFRHVKTFWKYAGIDDVTTSRHVTTGSGENDAQCKQSDVIE